MRWRTKPKRDRFSKIDFRRSRHSALTCDSRDLKSDLFNVPQRFAMLALKIEPMEAEQAERRMLASQNNDSGRAATANLREQEKGEAAEKAAAKIGASARIVQDAKQIEAHSLERH